MRLRGHDHAVGELLPAGVAERAAHRGRAAAVDDDHRELVAGGGRALQPDLQPAAAMGVLGGPGAVDRHLRHREPVQVEDEPVGVLARRGSAGSARPDRRLSSTP